MTLEALFRFSMEDRLLSEAGDGSSVFSLAGELGSLPCQKRRGEEFENGDEAAGEVSLMSNLDCDCRSC